MIIDDILMYRTPVGFDEIFNREAIKTWETHGYTLTYADVLTRLDLDDYEYLEFGQYFGNRDFTDDEKAWFYTHAEFWKETAESDHPRMFVCPNIAVIAKQIEMDDHVNVQSFTGFLDEKDFEIFMGEGMLDSHPFWNSESKCAPSGLAYGLTPKGAKQLLRAVMAKPIDLMPDELIFLQSGREEADVIGYCTPVIFRDDLDEEDAA